MTEDDYLAQEELAEERAGKLGKLTPPIVVEQEDTSKWKGIGTITPPDSDMGDAIYKDHKILVDENVADEKKSHKKLLEFHEFDWIKDKNDNIIYKIPNEKYPSFIQKEKEIEVMKNDESSILASMQLAQQMWGGVKISDASKDFCDTCIKLAAEYGIKIQLPKEYLVEKAKEDAHKQLEKSLERAKDAAAELVPRQNIQEASNGKSYKGTVIGNEQGVILLQTKKDEIVLVPEDALSKVPGIGERIEAKRPKNATLKREISFIEQEKGR